MLTIRRSVVLLLCMVLAVLGIADGATALEQWAPAPKSQADPGERPSQHQAAIDGSHAATSRQTETITDGGRAGHAPAEGELAEDAASEPGKDPLDVAAPALPVPKTELTTGPEVSAVPVVGFDQKSSTEVVGERDAQQRVYLNKDGTYTTRYYTAPVNFRRKDGSWQAIDAALEPRIGSAMGRSVAGQDGWTTKSGERELSFAAAADRDPLVSLDLGDGLAVGYALRGAAASAGSVEGESVTYRSVFPKADVEFRAGSDSFKEVLLLQDASAPTEWVFPLRLKGVSASIEDGALILKDGQGAVRGRMPAGWMEDSDQAPNSGGQGVVSSGVTYELIPDGAGTALKVKLDEQWLHAPDRVFPVKVDPSVTSVRPVEGTYVMSGYTADYSGDTELKVGTYNGGGNKAASFLKFSGVENTLRNASVLGVKLSVYNSWSSSCKAKPVTVHPVTSNWSQGSVRSWPGPSIGAALTSANFAHGWRASDSSAWSCAPAWEPIDLGEEGKNLVNRWTHGWQANYGLALKADDNDSGGWKRFGSDNSGAAAPSLDVTWSKYGADYELFDWVQPVTATQEGIFRVRAWNRGQETWTPGGNYKMSYLLFDQWNNNITSYGTNVAWTPVSADTPTNAGNMFEARIRPLPQGTYKIVWTMDDYGTKSFSADGITSPAMMFSSINIPPVLNRLAPPSQSVVRQLQPTLSAEGTDPDRSPLAALDYRFEVCRVVGQDARVDCKQSTWVHSGNFVVPEGWLSWNEQYAWYAEAGDGATSSAKSQPSYLRTLLPQPAQYATAADSGRDFNAAVGNYTTAATDAALPTVGPELSVTRSYNSLDPRTDGAFGAGWTSRWDMRVQVESSGWLTLPGNVVLTASNGARARFAWDGAKQAYIAGGGMAADLRKADGGGWTLTDRAGTVHTFDTAGRLTKVTDSAGHTQNLTYTGGKLSRATDALSGRYLDFTWTGSHITGVAVSGASGSWTYIYSGDRLTKVCPPGTAANATTGCTLYEYGTGSQYQAAVQDAGPIGYWRLGGSEGTADNTARTPDRAPAQSTDVTWGATGALTGSTDTAATFNGSTSYVELPAKSISGSTYRSVELWFRTAAPGVILTYQNRTMAEAPNNLVPALYVGSDGKLRGKFNTTGDPITSTGSVKDNAWHHVVLSGAQSSTALYLDGNRVGTIDAAIDHLDMTRTYLGGGYTGNWPGGNGGWSWFNGQIDDVALYDYPVTDQIAAEHRALRAGTAQLTKTVLPSGRTSTQIGYDQSTDRVSSIKDAAGSEWKVSAPTFTGGSFLYNNVVKASGPAAYWRLGERDGATAASEAGTGTGGSYGDGVSKRAPGVFAPTDDTAARFDGGAKSQLEVPDDTLRGTGDLAVELWFATDKPGVLIGDQERALDDPAGVGGSYTPLLYIGTDNKLHGRFGGPAATMASSGTVTDNTWHHAVLSAAGTTQTPYLDSTPVATATGAVNHQANTHTYLGAGFAKGAPAAPGDTGRLTGALDEAAVYRHPLSAGDVLAHYRARSSQVAGQGLGYRGSVVADAPAGYWRMDESAGTTAASEVAAIDGKGNYAPGVQLGTEGVFGVGDGRAATFKGTSNSYLDLPTPILQSGKELAAELWFRTAAPGVLLNYQNRTMAEAPNNTVPALYVGSDGKLRGALNGMAGGPLTSGTAVNDNAWHHTVLTAGPNGVSLYLDGTLVATATGTVDHLDMNRTYLGGGYTGSWPGGNGGWSWFNGQIDEVAFYQHPLSADRIAAHYQARSQSTATTLASRVTVTDPAGGTSTDVHDAQRGMRLISRTDPAGATTTYSYDTGGFLHTVTDPNGHSTVTGQDARGNTVSTTTCRDANSCWTSYTAYYLNKDDAKDPRNDRPTESRDARSSGPADNRYRTTITYTALGQADTTTLPDGRTLRSTYTTGTEPATGGGTTPAGLLAATTTAAGLTTTLTYYSSGDLASRTEPSGLRTTYTYDAMGRQSGTTVYSDAQPAGLTTTTAYDALSHVTSVTGPVAHDAVTGAAHQARTTSTYDADGRVLTNTVTDLLGGDPPRTDSTEYDSAGRIAKTTDAEGGTTGYGYDALGRTIRTTDALGQVTRFTYTVRGQLATTVVEGWNGDGQAARDAVVESRSYDPAGRLESVTDAMGAKTAYTYYDDNLLATTTATAVAQADGTSHPVVLERDEYDGAGRLTKQVTGGGRTTVTNAYDIAGRVVKTVTDPDGANRSATVEYDADDRIATATAPVSASENRITRNTYDSAGRLARTEVQSSASPLTAATTYTHDQRGLTTTSTSPNGNAPGADPAAFSTRYGYDELGRPTSIRLPAVQAESGGGTAATVNPTTTTGYNTFGETTSVKDPHGLTTTQTYDRLGRTTGTALPGYTPPGSTSTLTATTAVTYDALSRITESRDAAGRQTFLEYDRLGHERRRTDPNSTGGPLTPPVDDKPPVWTSTWTPTGLRLSVTDPVGGRSEATYDELGRTLTATVVERVPTLQNLTTRQTWDDTGNLVKTTTPGGATTTATYNALGEQLTTTDAAGRTSTVAYDGLGRTIKTTAPLGQSTDYGYDALGNATTATDRATDGTALRTRSTGYDRESHPVSSTGATGATTTRTYDAGGRLTTLTEPVAAGQNITTGFGYDAAGLRTRLTDGRGNTTVYTYTPWGLPESTVEPATTAYPAAADRTWTTSYDVAGQAVKLTEPGNIVRTRTFDPMGRLTKETGTGAEAATDTRTLRYDKAGRLVEASGIDINTQDFTYNDRDQLTEARVAGVNQSWEYDKDGRITDRWDAKTGTSSFGYKPDGQLAWSYDQLSGAQYWYGYDGNGRLATQYYAVKDANGAFNATSNRSYTYDQLGRLILDKVVTEAPAFTPVTSTSYDYDLEDRTTRRTVTGKPGDPATTDSYSYDQADRLTSWTTGTTTTAYAWDAAGNRTKNGAATAVYDERNRLVSDGTTTYQQTARGTLSATTTGGVRTTQKYDAFDRLADDGQNTYVYDGLDRMIQRGGTNYSYDGGTNNLITDGTWRYSRDTAGQLMSAADATGAKRIRTDQHTDITATLAVDGTSTTSTTAYDPFGKPVAKTGTTTSLGYQSGWTDPATGDVNMHARWYRPTTGAFTSRDSWQLDPNPSIQANRYTYAGGDPLDQTDPSGHCPFCVVAIAWGAVSIWDAVGAATAVSILVGGTAVAVDKAVTNHQTENAMPGSHAGSAATTYTPARPATWDICGSRCAGTAGGSSHAAAAAAAAAAAGGPAAAAAAGGGKSGACVYHCFVGTQTRPAPATKPAPTPVPDRPNPGPEWKRPDYQEILKNIVRVYSAWDLAQRFTNQNSTSLAPDQAPNPQPGTGASPGTGTGSSQPQSCLNSPPPGAESDDVRNSQSLGWIKYNDMEKIEGGTRSTGARACLVGSPSKFRGAPAGGDISGWAEARANAISKGFKVPSGIGGRSDIGRCHYIARQFGGRGVQENLAPCFQVGANTGKSSMASIEAQVSGALKNNQIVDYQVNARYLFPDSKIPLGFWMSAAGQNPDGTPGLVIPPTFVPNMKELNGIPYNMGTWG
ncbi:RHS repeat-associated protein [Kitasatospora sp. SolWspMP-SS2h]|uniref:LamG-like jellyroll fold domain-containing protein n=1 Tax=Kitasatospora sp. SolWspMP-SS2h TaxID=1305729 RepID=UPI000DBFE354|nr:LamG-like jellyroll fold domain-containing protein [Kitasatospora sp. SolWspMP-SS2h]RAJ32831.1 RHS repeat-associated protein [Kitasatospora sp. SolWspMP-SS2h]